MFDLFGKNKKKKVAQAERERLVKLEKNLKALGSMPLDKRGFEYALDFFNKVSFFQDQGKVSFAKNANEINTLINQAGREAYGWNRTKPGETVTIDNVYCGDRYGLFTFTLRSWMDSDSVYEGFVQRFHPNLSWKIKEDPYDWQVIILILEGFIDKKRTKLLKELESGINSLS